MKINLQFNALNLNALNSKKHNFHIREELCYERRQKIKHASVASASAPDHRIGCSLYPAENGRTDDWTIYELDHNLYVLQGITHK